MRKPKITKKTVGWASAALGVCLVALFIYTDEEMVALGGLVGHLWLMGLAAAE